MRTLQYVYGVAPAAARLADASRIAPRGIDRSAVALVAEPGAGLCAITSELDATRYDPQRMGEAMQQAEWLAPRAIEHDAVMTWAADNADLVPFPMWVMFTDAAAVMRMLSERADEFRTAIGAVAGAREYGVRVSADADGLASLAELAARGDGSLADLEQQARMASPGQAYLLRRKLAEQRKSAVRNIAARTAESVHDRLAALSRASMTRASPLSREPGVILDAAYLVEHSAYESFRSLVSDLMGEYDAGGVRLEFTGPWPPYHFVHAA